MNKELDACKAKPGGCSDEESRAIFNEYKALSDQNIAQVQACVFTGDTACVSNATKDAASRAEVQNTALDPFQQNVLTQRQTNAGTNSVTGGNGVSVSDLTKAQEIADFRRNNCSGLSTAQCDTKVVDAMKNGQLACDAVKMEVGGNLNIETLQDSTSYASKQSSSGLDVSICVPPICYGEFVTATVDYSKQKVNHNYQSATGQSGIVAGNGGFDITVKGNTDLKGGAITSTAPIDKNSFTTGSLSTSDLENKQRTSSSSTALSLTVPARSLHARLTPRARRGRGTKWKVTTRWMLLYVTGDITTMS
ncbi:hemagglutinin repeat-containing protein [Variovorax paradoxus]|nr:hemagglutinin repeat-containing protein [Variovorax paradoxus]